MPLDIKDKDLKKRINFYELCSVYGNWSHGLISSSEIKPLMRRAVLCLLCESYHKESLVLSGSQTLVSMRIIWKTFRNRPRLHLRPSEPEIMGVKTQAPVLFIKLPRWF